MPVELDFSADLILLRISSRMSPLKREASLDLITSFMEASEHTVLNATNRVVEIRDQASWTL